MRLEPKPAPSLAITLLYPAMAIVATFVIAAVLVMIAGAEPLQVFALVLKGAVGSQFALVETLTRATPLIFTGLAIAVAFRAKLWNIGAEAQLYAGAVMTVLLGTLAGRNRNASWPKRGCRGSFRASGFIWGLSLPLSAPSVSG